MICMRNSILVMILFLTILPKISETPGSIGNYRYTEFSNIGGYPIEIKNAVRFIIDRGKDEEFAIRLAEIVYDISYEYNVDFTLIIAIMRVESDFDSTAISYAGARGLMQIRTTTQYGRNIWKKELIRQGIIEKEKQIFEIKRNIEAGAMILKLYMLRHGYEYALNRYSNNARNYVQKVQKTINTINGR